MGIYLTPTGFQGRTLQEIRLDLEQAARDAFGPAIDIRPEGRTGHLIGLLAKALADGWDGTAEIVAGLDPSQAEGVFLDIICYLVGVFRLAASKATAECICYTDAANDGLLLPAGRQARRLRGSLVFSLQAPITLSSAACRDIYLRAVPDLIPGASVTLTTSFGTFTVTVPATATPTLSTYQLLATAINAASWTGTAEAYAQGAGTASAQLDEDCLRLVDPADDFAVVAGSPWVFSLIGSAGSFICSVFGNETVDTGEIAEIGTPEPGWEAVYNLVSGISGREAETDAALRIRREQMLRTGNATERAMLNALYNRVDGIQYAVIRSNRTLVVDANGLPPKSYEAIAQGGTSAAVAEVLWDTQPAGIESFGAQEITVIDSEGTPQIVKFNRPTEQWLWVEFRYKLYSEEIFPDDGETLIRDTVLAWAASELTINKDVFPDRIKAPVMIAVPGIGEAQVRIQLTTVGGTIGAWGTTPIVIGVRDFAALAGSRLFVLEGGF